MKKIFLFLFILSCTTTKQDSEKQLQYFKNTQVTTPGKFFKKNSRILEYLVKTDDADASDDFSISCNQIFANKKPMVMHATLEFAETTVGGLGSTVNTLIKKLAENKIETPFRYAVGIPLFSPFEKRVKNAEKICDIKHIFANKTAITELYWEKATQGYDVFFFKPTGEFENIFNLSATDNVYNASTYSSHLERIAYFSSAMASISIGFKRNFNLKIIQSHSTATSLLGPIIQEIHKEDSRAKIITTIHNLSYDQDGYSEYIFFDEALNLFKVFMYYSDYIHTVSSSMIADGLDADIKKSYGLAWYFKRAFENQRIKAIHNGIDREKIDPYHNPNNFKTKDEAIPVDLSIAPTESLIDWKKRLKKFLKTRGFISDETRPLFVFVGRYAKEKGIQYLQTAAEAISSMGGSLIVMGMSIKDPKSDEIIKNLASKKIPHVYVMKGDIVSEQLYNNMGNIIRGASDFSFVPSINEAFGLVPIEFFCMGSPTVTSGVQGMRDYFLEFNQDLTRGNGLSFDIKDTKKSIPVAISQAINLYTNNTNQLSNIMTQIYNESAKYSWDYKGGSLDAMVELYESLSD